MKTIEFKIIYNKNENIYQEGYVEVPSDVEELPEWFYYDQQGFAIPGEFTHHDEIGLTQIGATAEQEAELQKFYEITHLEEVDFIDEVIVTADEDEHRTYIRDDITIIVNDGAKFEVEVCKYDPLDFYTNYSNAFEIGRQYFMTFKPKFNGKSIAGTIKENIEYGILENPYTFNTIVEKEPLINQEEGDFNKDSIAMEIPKVCFEWEDDYDESIAKEIIDEYKNALEDAYRKALVRELGVYGIAYNFTKELILASENPIQAMNEGYIDGFASNSEQSFEDMNVEELYFMSSDDVERILKEEGEF